MPDPLVSIIIPCYNAEEYIADAIQSALGQTYQSCEVIVVDDGSTDHTEEVINQFGDAVRLTRCPHLGANHARNVGMHAARGEWIQFLDADDYLSPFKIETQLEACQRLNASMIYGSYSCVHGAPDPRLATMPSTLGVHWGPTPVFTSLWTGIYKRGLLATAGGWNEALRLWQDVEYNMRLAKLCPECLVSGQALYYMRVHSSRDRIATLKKRPEGIHEGLKTLEICEKSASDGSVRFSEAIRTMYERLIWCTLKRGSVSQLRQLIDKALNSFPNDKLFRRIQRGIRCESVANLRLLACVKNWQARLTTGKPFDFTL
jgi:glycosyltransferase involved in cell wall biosynthesis